MTPREIEAWAIRVIESVEAGNSVEETTRVELKAQWPDDVNKAARQIAGQANAARGDPMFWLIGVDEKAGVIGASSTEFTK
jgi:hypothetical protein